MDISYVAVAANISILLAELKIARTAAKTAVNAIVMLIFLIVFFTKYRISIVITGNMDDSTVAKTVLARSSADSSYDVNPLSSSTTLPIILFSPQKRWNTPTRMRVIHLVKRSSSPVSVPRVRKLESPLLSQRRTSLPLWKHFQPFASPSHLRKIVS